LPFPSHLGLSRKAMVVHFPTASTALVLSMNVGQVIKNRSPNNVNLCTGYPLENAKIIVPVQLA
jgi:hypothetical protein